MDMVIMFMGYQDGINFRKLNTNSSQSSLQLNAGHACINEDARFPGLKISSIPLAAAA
jgi:hypothetical protein